MVVLCLKPGDFEMKTKEAAFMQARSATLPLHLYALPSGPLKRVCWRQKGVGVLRIIFGLVWGVDAWFKWQPDFQQNFVSYLTGTLNGQPPAIHIWITFWSQVINANPFLFAHLVALGETALAIGLIFGIFSNVTNVGGLLWSLMIWSTAEGFGGPYAPGSTDIGTAIIYAIAFAGLFLTSAGLSLGLDQYLTPRLGRFAFLASGSIKGKHKGKK